MVTRRRSVPVDMSAVRPVQVPRLTDEVADKIRSFVLDHDLVAGTRLPSERNLAEMLGASRPTVSQALRSLSLTGLVEIRRGSGAYVLRQPDRSIMTSLTTLFELERDNVTHLVELRQWLEQLGVQEAATRRTRDDLAGLRDSLRRLADSVGETSTWIAADTVFHATVVAVSGNPFLTAIYESVHTAVLRYEYQSWVDRDEVPQWLRPDAAEGQLALHEPIVTALESGDVAAALAAVARHNAVMRQHLDSR
jgi:GntR family transcriptional repressor for pyruvate dehydrogenase complex